MYRGFDGVGLDLGPQPLDVDVERLGVADVVGAPHPVDELHAGEHAAGVAQQHLQQLELLERQLHLLAADGDDVALDVHADRPRLERSAGASSSASPRRRSTARMRATSSREENGLVT